MTSDKQAHKFYTKDMHYPDLGSASAGHAVREISFNQTEAQARSG